MVRNRPNLRDLPSGTDTEGDPAMVRNCPSLSLPRASSRVPDCRRHIP
jgi:hypothetical protein